MGTLNLQHLHQVVQVTVKEMTEEKSVQPNPKLTSFLAFVKELDQINTVLFISSISCVREFHAAQSFGADLFIQKLHTNLSKFLSWETNKEAVDYINFLRIDIIGFRNLQELLSLPRDQQKVTFSDIAALMYRCIQVLKLKKDEVDIDDKLVNAMDEWCVRTLRHLEGEDTPEKLEASKRIVLESQRTRTGHNFVVSYEVFLHSHLAAYEHTFRFSTPQLVAGLIRQIVSQNTKIECLEAARAQDQQQFAALAAHVGFKLEQPVGANTKSSAPDQKSSMVANMAATGAIVMNPPPAAARAAVVSAPAPAAAASAPPTLGT